MVRSKAELEGLVRKVFLRNIGASSIEEVNGWFSRSYAGGYAFNDLDKAVSLINAFKGRRITIVGDYDSDGVNASGIMWLALKKAGFTDVRVRIPHRFSEGFGINPVIIDEIPAESLIITVDNGIAAVDVIQKAKNKGITVLLTDHHLPNADGVLPPADLIIDPNVIEGQADFTKYCGAAIAYKVAEALLGKGNTYLKRLLPMAAIATITDVMELREDNYVIAKNGLKLLGTPGVCTAGLEALVECLNLSGKPIGGTDIGFAIGPCINAASRMKDDGAIDALKLLTWEGDSLAALSLADVLIRRNDVRKGAKREALEAAENAILLEGVTAPIVLNVPGIPEGVIGIVAGQLCEQYNRPAIVLSEHDGVLKGSARSIEPYNIKEELDKAADFILRYGGHSGAAGLTVELDKFEAFKDTMLRNGSGYSFPPKDLTAYDLTISADEVPTVCDILEKYEPFGEANEKIKVKVENFETTPRYGSCSLVLGGTVLKLFSNNSVALWFGMAKKEKDFSSPSRYSITGTLAKSYFKGKASYQIEISDLKEDKIPAVVTPLAARLAAMAGA